MLFKIVARCMFFGFQYSLHLALRTTPRTTARSVNQPRRSSLQLLRNLRRLSLPLSIPDLGSPRSSTTRRFNVPTIVTFLIAFLYFATLFLPRTNRQQAPKSILTVLLILVASHVLVRSLFLHLRNPAHAYPVGPTISRSVPASPHLSRALVCA